MHSRGNGSNLLLFIPLIKLVFDQNIARSFRQKEHLVLRAILDNLLPLNHQLLLWCLKHSFHPLYDIF